MLKDNRNKIVFIIALLVVLGVVVAIAMMFINKDKDANKVQPTSKPSATAKVTPTPKPTQTPTLEPTSTPKPTISPDLAQSRLTGEYIDKELAMARPYAVMFNNHKAASPHSGISEVDVLYECLTEGGITRLMGISQKFSVDRIGSIRSARHYFVSFAKDWDAIYIHIGGSQLAENKIKELKIADLDGKYGIGNTLIYRDKSIKAPHNAFTSADKIAKSVKIKEFRTNYEGKEDNHFTFNEEEIATGDKNANKVTIKFSSYTSPYFVYDSKEKLYGRFQFGKEHVDYNTKEQLKFKNIIVMSVEERTIDKDGRQDMGIKNNTGDGWYISCGKMQKIKWKKKEADSSMQFLDLEGNLLSINTGKTYIGVIPLERVSDFKVSE